MYYTISNRNNDISERARPTHWPLQLLCAVYSFFCAFSSLSRLASARARVVF